MSFGFLTPEQALEYDALRALVAVGSFVVEDYVSPFKSLVASNFLDRLLRSTISDLAGLASRLEMSTGDDNWRLLLTDRFSLGLRKLPDRSLGRNRLPPGPSAVVSQRHLAAAPNDLLLGVCGRGRIVARFYRSAFDRDEEVFSPAHRIELVDERTLSPGDCLVLRASHDVIDFVDVDGQLAMLELALTNARKIVWNYDAETLRASFPSSASVDATRLEFAIDLFRLFDDREAVPNLCRLAREHSHHWVRWKAVKAVLLMDLPTGLELLQSALEDPHSHVRNAATATLTNLRNANLAPERRPWP